MNTSKLHETDFLNSALAKDSKVNPTLFALDWLKQKNDRVKTSVEQVPLGKLGQWSFSPETGNIVHQSGRFFSVEGTHVETNWGKVSSWEQPIINQPEVGWLGILTKKIGGVLHFLMQAKIEPGNINAIQLSPTLQATKSNYTRVHKGKSSLYLEYFNGEKPVNILVDQLQSEQGARFFKKRNRNIIIEVPGSEALPEYDDFIWLTLGQLKKLISYDNVVNMDTRTVLSGINFATDGGLAGGAASSLLSAETPLNDFDMIISWITRLKLRYELNTRLIPLKDVADWGYDGLSYRHRDGKYFSVIGVKVQIDTREVVSWDQPMIKPAQEGLIAFIVKEINGVYHFLVQAKIEVGNFDVLEFAPTVQCLTGNYRTGYNEYSVPFINDILFAPKDRIWYSARQSEEGGRFYKEQNLNMIIEVKDDFPVEVPGNYCWMTLNQLLTFIKFNNYLNIAARSLLSAVVI